MASPRRLCLSSSHAGLTRELHLHGSAGARGGVEEDLAVKLFDQLAADGQAQAVTFDSRVLVARKAKERLENPLERFGGYAWPVVDHRHAPVSGSGLPPAPDMSARGGDRRRARHTRRIAQAGFRAVLSPFARRA